MGIEDAARRAQQAASGRRQETERWRRRNAVEARKAAAILQASGIRPDEGVIGVGPHGQLRGWELRTASSGSYGRTGSFLGVDGVMYHSAQDEELVTRPPQGPRPARGDKRKAWDRWMDRYQRTPGPLRGAKVLRLSEGDYYLDIDPERFDSELADTLLRLARGRPLVLPD